MAKENNWNKALINVIDQCLISGADINPWYSLEELVASDQVEKIYKDEIYGSVAGLMDDYCNALGHDEDKVCDTIKIDEAKELLAECKKILKGGRTDFPEKIKSFKWE